VVDPLDLLNDEQMQYFIVTTGSRFKYSWEASVSSTTKGKSTILKIPAEESTLDLSSAETVASLIYTDFEDRYKRSLSEIVHTPRETADKPEYRRIRLLLANSNETSAKINNRHLQSYYLYRAVEKGCCPQKK